MGILQCSLDEKKKQKTEAQGCSLKYIKNSFPTLEEEPLRTYLNQSKIRHKEK